MKNKHPLVALACLWLLINSHSLNAQTDLFKDSSSPVTEKVRSTFKGTRIVSGHSVENVGRGILDFRISHRFGTLNSGSYNFFGLDNAYTRLALDYGITDRLMVGISRGTYDKEFTALLKYKILQQSTGPSAMPITMSYVGTGMWRTIKNFDPTASAFKTQNFFHSHQLLIARKFNDYTSLQLMPTMVYYSATPKPTDNKMMWSMGVAARQRVSKRVNLTGEYYYQFTPFDGYTNSMSFGVDIETGGHVFQLHLTNSYGTTERSFIHETTGKWGDGDIHFGFNISRVFTIVKPKDFKNKW